ncbi:MAG: molybdopterin cofactor-binding domain-containing protein [Candidatus Acidiferrales bacterium]|jgi:isoquinoline 1-oxidoreductase beta subunit
MKNDLMFDRRDFLKTGAAGGAALVIGFYLPVNGLARDEQEEKSVNPFNAWVRIGQDDRVTLILAKSEMGQGVMTALPMILADELELDWKNVKVEQAPTNPAIYDHGTGGSTSVRTSWLPLRRAGAAARTMLIAAAANEWNVNPNTCKAAHGAVIHGARERTLRYGELVEAASKLPVPNLNTVVLKNSDNFSLVGHDTPRVDTPEKVDGTAIFGIDARPPGLLYAVVERCPVFGGKVAKFDAAKAKAVPGVREVLAIDRVGPGAFTEGGVAVVADSSWAAMQGRRALAVDWDFGPHAKDSSESLRNQMLALAAKPGSVVRNDGDADAALAAASKKIEAAYELPFQPHATMEPMNCTVHVRPDGAEAWVPTQTPQWALDVIATISGLKKESIQVHTTLMGGGFGRRAQADFVAEAAQVSKALGKPVMVLWTREDDMQHDFYRPASYHRMWGALDSAGNLAAWKHFQTSTSISAMWGPPGGKPENGEFGTAAFIPYQTPNYRLEYALAQSGVPRAWWRSVENSSVALVVESFVDELAAAAGKDPVEFRLQLIGSARKIPDFTSPNGAPQDTARLKNVLTLAASKAGWGKPLPKSVGRGIAAYFCFDSYAAVVAEVAASKDVLRVNRVVYAVDVGRVVNPQGVKAQLESALVYGLSAALKGAITIDRGRVEQGNFNDYDVPRINEMPVTEVHLVESTESPTGIGEPGLPVVAPAVCNAIFAATGKRLRLLPIRAGDLA